MTTAELVQHDLQEGVTLQDLGWHRFRGLSRRERVFQVDIPGLPADFPALKSLDTPRNNLPSQLTSFVGREKEIAEAQQLLSHTRLMTLTGPGGAGKTRLSLRLAREVLNSFDDGAWIVQLAMLFDPELVPNKVVSTLGAREQPGGDLVDTLTDYLRPKKILLILDNCEHLIEACAQLANSLLQACPQLKIVASSRESLNVMGETSYRVPSLTMPNSNGQLTAEEVVQFEAVQLFLERARTIQPGFSLDDANAAAVLQICRRLDGIPLAIELAATRVRLLSPEQIAARLDDRFRLLTDGRRNALPHQQTLRASIDWSYELLPEAERVLLGRLSVFFGGWSLEAAEAVCGDLVTDRNMVEGSDLLDLTGHLVDKSLVVVDDRWEEPRYYLLDTIRLYAAEKLLAIGESTAVRDRHLAYYTQLAAEADPALFGPHQLQWLKRLDAEHDNLLAALARAKEGDAVDLLRLAASLGRYWSIRTSVSEGRKWLKLALARFEASPVSQATAKSSASAEDKAKAYRSLGLLAIRHGEIHEARLALEASVELFRALDSQAGLALALSLLALSELMLSDLEKASIHGEESVTLGRQSGDMGVLSYALSVLGRVHMEAGADQSSARTLLEESVAICRYTGARWAMAVPLRALAALAYHLGDYDGARSGYREAQTIFEELNDLYFVNICRSGQADVARQIGENDLATTLFKETLVAWQELGHRGGAARCMECLAFLTVSKVREKPGPSREQMLNKAARMLGAAEAIRETNEIPMTDPEREDYDHEVAILEAEMEASALAAPWAQGRVLAQEEGAAYALAEEIDG
jgi:non-specific serine/threonine protein kinase